MLKYTIIIFALLVQFNVLNGQYVTNFNTTVNTTYNIKSIGKLNTTDAEFSPVIYHNDLVFVSDRENDLVKYGEAFWRKKRHLNVFKAGLKSPADDSVYFQKTELFDKNLANAFHCGPIGFHPSGEYAIVTRVVSTLKTNKPQLYLLKLENKKWSKPTRISFCENSFSYGHAQFSNDGKTIYFSSDQIGTLGGKDIFKCSFENGTLGSPENLGDSINSAANEMYPFFAENTLYFSSDRKSSFGGLDVYKSELDGNTFKQATNLGETINSAYDDFSFYLTPSGKNGFIASNRLGKGNDDIYFFTVTQTATVVSKNILGKFTYAKLTDALPAGLQLQLLDEAGNVVQTTTTDANGEFRFTNLPADQNFTIKVVELAPDLILQIYNQNGKEYAMLMSDSKGSFVYKKLDNNEVGTLAFMQVEDVDLNSKTGKINGQFIHEKLNGGSVDGLKVMLVDEAGNIFATTTTDKNGNFNFSKLPTDQNFFITTDNNSDDLKLLLYNNKDEVIAELKRRGKNPFVFRRLDGKLDNSLTLLENEDIKLFPDNYTNLNGKFKLNKINGTPKELDFMVLDEAGNVVAKSKTDKNGNFILTGLPPANTYIFKLEGDEAGLNSKQFNLQMLDRFNQELQFIDANEAGLYVFDRKPKQTTQNNTSNTFENTIIYFTHGSSELNPEGKAKLKEIAIQMKQNPLVSLQIDGHTDASGEEGLNTVLSMQRMLHTRQFLVSLGITAKRIKGAYYGESKLVNACTNSDQCSDAENALNRRCELKIITVK